MKKIQIYALQEDKERLLKAVQELAVIELSEFEPGPEIATAAANPANLNGELDLKIAEIGRALGFLDQIAPIKPGIVEQFAGVKTYLTPTEFAGYLKQEERLRQVLGELREIEAKLSQLQINRNQLQTLTDTLTPWEKLDLEAASLKGTESIQVILGLSEAPEKLLEALTEMEAPFYYECLGRNNQNANLLFIAQREDFPKILAELGKNSFTPVTLPTFETTVAAKLNEIRLTRGRLEKEEARQRAAAVALAETRPLLQVFHDTWNNQRQRNDESRKLINGESSLGVSGWIMADKAPVLQEKLAQLNILNTIVLSDPEEGEEPPTVLKNKPVLTPFEYLVQSFSNPLPREIDPTPLIAPFFFIFFGIALGDAGYGIILSIICAVILLKLKIGPVGKKISWMFLLSGLGAVGFGLLTGSVLSLPNLKFGVFSPLENPILLLIIVLALGMVQLYLGVIVSAWGNIKEGRWADVLWNQGFWLFFLTSVVLALGKDAFGLGGYSTTLNYLLLFAAAGVVIGNTRGKKGIVAKLLAIPGGLFTIYGSIGFFSDVLSYSRLMALGLSGGVMGGIMNQLAGMVIQSVPIIGWVLGAVIFLFGHILNLALSVLGAYVHSSRLQYLEFFGKFYEGGGRTFTPLKNKPKYTFLINEREAN